MIIAGAINASMLIVAAALFFKNGLHVEDLDVAFNQFSNLVGPVSAALFGIGLYQQDYLALLSVQCQVILLCKVSFECIFRYTYADLLQ